MNPDIAYIAGLIDGEGYFGISKVIRKKPCYYVRFSINMRDREGLMTFEKVFNMKINKGKNNGKTMYSILGKIEDIEKLIRTTLPFLKVKKREATICLDLIEHRKKHPPQKLRKEGKFQGTKSYDKNILNYREKLYRACHNLKIYY